MITEYIASVTDPYISVATLAKWVRDIAPREADTLPKALIIARTMVFGESWRPDLSLWVEFDKAAVPAGVTLTKIELKDQYDLEREEHAKECAEQQTLLQRAANGDAAAALEYCRLEAAGQIWHEGNAVFG